MTVIRKGVLKGAVLACMAAGCGFAQFSSGSSGVDGALNFQTAGTFDFNPAALGLDTDGDNVFHFTTINIPPGVTIRLRGSLLKQKPVVWLATGNVTIGGILDLSGATGVDLTPSTIDFLRVPTEPGPGGFPGGVGTRGGLGSAQPGFGPAGGTPRIFNSCAGKSAGSDPTVRNSQLVPLIGGSGGAGGGADISDITPNGGLGGAGGGAIRIASSTSITVTGKITAIGGSGVWFQYPGFQGQCRAGSGAGGTIHLIANTIAGNGRLEAYGGAQVDYQGNVGADGQIRLSANSNNFSGTFSPVYTSGAPFVPPLQVANPGSIRISTVNGVAVPANPTGNRLAPDVTINAATAVTVAIAGTNIPLGTVVQLTLLAESPLADQVISCSPLAGTVASSTATCSGTFPLGVTVSTIRAVW